MSKTRRPDVFNEEALVQHFIDEGSTKKDAQVTVSCMRLLIPTLIAELGSEQLVEIMKSKSAEFGLVADEWWKHESPRIVEWAKKVLSDYGKARKKNT